MYKGVFGCYIESKKGKGHILKTMNEKGNIVTFQSEKPIDLEGASWPMVVEVQPVNGETHVFGFDKWVKCESAVVKIANPLKRAV